MPSRIQTFDALRGGQEFAFGVVRDGLVLTDNGRYREALIMVDEEGLEPRPLRRGRRERGHARGAPKSLRRPRARLTIRAGTVAVTG